MPGAGLCPGYTISRAILADAVCLTRGDRFLTVDCTRTCCSLPEPTESSADPRDLTAFNLTAWGYQDVQYDRADGAIGGMLHKMLYRTLPEWYPAGSVYATFPFIVPTRMREFVEAMPEVDVHKYGWSRPTGPQRAVEMNGSGTRASVGVNGSANGVNGHVANGYASPAGRVESLLRNVLPDVSSVSAPLVLLLREVSDAEDVMLRVG